MGLGLGRFFLWGWFMNRGSTLEAMSHMVETIRKTVINKCTTHPARLNSWSQTCTVGFMQSKGILPPIPKDPQAKGSLSVAACPATVKG